MKQTPKPMQPSLFPETEIHASPPQMTQEPPRADDPPVSALPVPVAPERDQVSHWRLEDYIAGAK